MARENSYQFTIDKLSSKLNGWKSKILTLAGKKTLIQSVLQSLPPYFMQCSYIPKKICNKIDSISRNFLWGTTSEKKKMHLMC